MTVAVVVYVSFIVRGTGASVTHPVVCAGVSMLEDVTVVLTVRSMRTVPSPVYCSTVGDKRIQIFQLLFFGFQLGVDGGCWVSEVRAGATSSNPDHE